MFDFFTKCHEQTTVDHNIEHKEHDVVGRIVYNLERIKHVTFVRVKIFFARDFVVDLVGKRLERRMNVIQSVLKQFVARNKATKYNERNYEENELKLAELLEKRDFFVFFGDQDQATERKSEIGQTRAGLERVAQKMNDYDLEILTGLGLVDGRAEKRRIVE